MRILVLQGGVQTGRDRPRFCAASSRVTREAGHDVERVDAAYARVAPCTGCVACGYEGPCVQADGMDALRKGLLAEDMVALATPLYYYGMTAQTKTIIDRFCSANFSITDKRLKSVLLAVA